MCDKSSSSHERKVQGYLKPKTHVLFEGFVTVNEVSDSAAINMIVKDYFHRITEDQKNAYLSAAKKKNTY